MGKWTSSNSYLLFLYNMLKKHLGNTFLLYLVVENLQRVHEISRFFLRKTGDLRNLSNTWSGYPEVFYQKMFLTVLQLNYSRTPILCRIIGWLVLKHQWCCNPNRLNAFNSIRKGLWHRHLAVNSVKCLGKLFCRTPPSNHFSLLVFPFADQWGFQCKVNLFSGAMVS